MADAATGAVRTVFEETEKTHFESQAGWRVLWATNEVIWYSQRDNWGHLYLYDLATGRLKNQITSGEGPVTQIVRVDEKSRTVWFTAMGREKGQDPYFRHLYRIGLDGKGYVSLTPEVGDHDHAAVGFRQGHRRHVLDVRDAAGGRAARRRGTGGGAAREGGHHEARWPRGGSRRCPSS